MPYRKEIREYPNREGRARRDWALADGNRNRCIKGSKRVWKGILTTEGEK
jgi:hypothetical protein